MIEILAIKSACAITAKHAGATIAWSIPFAIVIAALPEFKVDLAIYGAMGGLTRWFAIKCDWRDGLGGVIVGTLMALGFEGASLPYLKELVAGAQQIAHCSSYVYGLAGGLIFDWIISFAKVKAKS